MAFSEQIRLMVDVVTGNSKSALSSLKSDLNDADGAFNKVKVAGSASFDFIKQNAAGFALGAGTALVGFAAQSVAAFQDTALGAGQLRDSLGVTSEEASRLQEVAGDLGIPIGSLESSIGRMNRTAATTPGLFAEIGAEISRNADGTVNTTETYLNVIDALNRIPDPTQRAAAAQQILGKSWMDSSELIAKGADGVREAMASVEDGKIIDDSEIATARAFRDTMDDLKGVLEEASVTIGGVLVPVLTSVGDTITATSDAVDGLGNSLGGGENFFTTLTRSTGITGDALNKISPILGTVRDALTGAGDASEDAASSVETINAATRSYIAQGAAAAVVSAELTTEQQIAAGAHEALSVHIQSVADAEQAATDAANAQREAQDALNSTLLDGANAFKTAADLAMELEEAQQQVMVVAGDNTATLNELTQAVDSAAQAEVEHAVAAYRAEGAILSETQKLDINNSALLRQASQLQGPQRQAILDYIGQINGIPPERMSEIAALLNRGSVSEADGEIQRASRPRQSTVYVDANTAAAESEIQSLIRTRNMTINANVVQRGGAGYGVGAFAGGGTADQDGTYLVGEHGPERVKLNRGDHVFRESETRAMQRGVDNGGAPVINIYSQDITGAVAAFRQEMWRTNAVPKPGQRR